MTNKTRFGKRSTSSPRIWQLGIVWGQWSGPEQTPEGRIIFHAPFPRRCTRHQFSSLPSSTFFKVSYQKHVCHAGHHSCRTFNPLFTPTLQHTQLLLATKSDALLDLPLFSQLGSKQVGLKVVLQGSRLVPLSLTWEMFDPFIFAISHPPDVLNCMFSHPLSEKKKKKKGVKSWTILSWNIGKIIAASCGTFVECSAVQAALFTNRASEWLSCFSTETFCWNRVSFVDLIKPK